MYYIKKDFVFIFISKVLELLEDGGLLLFGDLPNSSKKIKFLNSKIGNSFLIDWKNKMKSDKSSAFDQFEIDELAVVIDDEFILNVVKMCRNKGFEAFILPQNPNLPFGHTREDILIRANS